MSKPGQLLSGYDRMEVSVPPPMSTQEEWVFTRAIIAALPSVVAQDFANGSKEMKECSEPSPWVKLEHCDEPFMHDETAKASIAIAVAVLENYRAMKWGKA